MDDIRKILAEAKNQSSGSNILIVKDTVNSFKLQVYIILVYIIYIIIVSQKVLKNPRKFFKIPEILKTTFFL